MAMSMTGFGRGQAESPQFKAAVEMKSVNHRFCEMVIRMPRALMKLEDKIKKELSPFISRGRLEIFITIEGEGLIQRKMSVDWSLLEDYYQLVNKMKDSFHLHNPIDLKDLLNQPGFISIEESEQENTEVENLIISAVKDALNHLLEMRKSEGDMLKKDLKHLLESFQTEWESVKKIAPSVVEQYKSRLHKKMVELTDCEMDEWRIVQEAAIFADKSDISEELTRISSHLAQFAAALDADGAIGRKLDFIIQELNREVNTIGSKANHAGISMLVVEMKTLLEKMREQVQNIE
ncbi:YicC/YloC family endoribonuclease [Falsibacillus pallidus]|uniref:YicC/YloC family endoribonuclease n=1 Tax=Falsibacillus pallidus TaxID=493781 RepID=UPI003D99DAAD